MNDNSSLAYPAEYYYPEFIYSRPDDPQTSSPLQLPLVTSVDNGNGSSTKVPATVQQINELPMRKQQSSTRLAVDVVTDQGLPDTGMTKTAKTDPKNNLLRDPAERNIPRLIVDDSVIRQTLQTPRPTTKNFDNHYEQTARYNQMNNGKTSLNNGHINKDLMNKTKSYEAGKQQTVKYADEEQQQQPIDDHWKKEVHIDDHGVVTIEPIVYEEPSYEGPFGLTRMGSYIFYIGMGVFTALAAIFLIMTAAFYGQSYPDSSTNSGKLAGIGICLFAFYVGLQLILIGLWHQKYRKENPKAIIKSSIKHDNSPTHVKSTKPTIEDNNNIYDYSYQQQMDYIPYETYAGPPYIPNGNEQMLLQGTPPGTGFYQPAVWPSNVDLEGQPDPRFFQPMDWTYGQQQPSNGTAPTSELITTNNNKSQKKSHRKKKTVEVDPPKAKSNKVFLNSSVNEPPLPLLKKAPETKETMQQIADMENNIEQTPSDSALTIKNVNRMKTVDEETEVSSLNDHRHRHSDRRHHHHHHNNNNRHSHRSHHHHDRHQHSRHHHRRRHQSHSPCSICSYNEFYSEVSYDPHQHHHYVEPIPIVITPRSTTKIYRDNGVGTEVEKKQTKDSSVTADLEDVSMNHDNSLQPIPIVHRTVIVEPYPAEPSSQIIVKPRIDMIGKLRLDNNQNVHDNTNSIPYLTATPNNKKSKKKKNTTESKDNIIEDLNLEDVHEDGYSSSEFKKKKPNRILTKKSVKNAFYN